MSERTKRILALALKATKPSCVVENSEVSPLEIKTNVFSDDLTESSGSEYAVLENHEVSQLEFKTSQSTNDFNNHLAEESDDYDSDKDPEYVPDDPDPNTESDTNTASDYTKNIASTDTNIASGSAFSVEQNIMPLSSGKKSRKRKRNISAWKCNVRKHLKLAGKQYISKKGKVMRQKELKPPCFSSCKKNCSQLFDEQSRLNIFKNFWKEGNTDDFKRQFIAGSVTQKPVSRRTVLVTESRRNFTLSYSLQLSGKKIDVCKTFFLNTLDISDTAVKTAIGKQSDGGIILPDQRGKQTPSNKLPEEVRNNVRAHINSFPLIESHYSRERTDKKYLGSDLNKAKMYSLYIEYCKSQNLDAKLIAKEWVYFHIFDYEFNLSFKQPSNDTCDTCDAFVLRLKSEDDEEEKVQIQQAYESHLNEAKSRYELKKQDKETSKHAGSKKFTIMIDLQKCLPTPYLTNSQAFYLRKLWTLNLTILNATNGKSHCAMWDETVGARGGCEIASCILKWAQENLGAEIEELTVWSDNCAGQNRNFMIVSAYLWILRTMPTLKVITHKYLLKGHTHMEVDGVHSVIERAKKLVGQTQMMVPWDWQQFVRQCRFKDLIEVYDMTLKDFKNFKSLYEHKAPLKNNKSNTNGEKFLISEAVELQLRSSEPNKLFYKTNFQEEHKIVDLEPNRRRKESNQVWPAELPALNTKPRPINKNKFEDLQKLLTWVPSCFHHYYKNIDYSAAALDYPD